MERIRLRSGVFPFSSLIPLLLLLGATSSGSQSISLIGYDLSTVTDSSSRPDKVKGNVLLLDNAVQRPGILFAFSVLVENAIPFTLQLYHVDVPGRTYHMGQQFTIIPSVQSGREDIYIESLLNRPCILVQPGDRLALYATSDPLAVQANFNASSLLGLCQLEQTSGILSCNSPQFPYSIRAAAYYKVSNDSSPKSTTSGDDVDCPFGTLIPGSGQATTIATTTVPLVTGVPGEKGATGMQGSTGNTGAQGVRGSTGSIGPPGEPGPVGYTGVQGVDGATGSTGSRGVMGATGAPGAEGPSEIGNRGIPGPPGPPGPMGHNFTVFLNQQYPRNQAVQQSDETSDSTDPFWSSSRSIWATFIWLAIVSLILLIVVIVIVVVVCIQRSSSTPLGSSPVTAESRTNIMDDDAPSNYSDLGSVEH